MGIASESGDLLIGGRFEVIFIVVIVREEGEPAGSDLEVGPGGDDVGAGTKDEVVVVGEDGVPRPTRFGTWVK